VIIGGFHTSGTINMLGEQEPEIQDLVKESISVVSDEVEGNWAEILADALHGRLKPIYSFAQDLQNLVRSAMRRCRESIPRPCVILPNRPSVLQILPGGILSHAPFAPSLMSRAVKCASAALRVSLRCCAGIITNTEFPSTSLPFLSR
jgi:hypothetical protein